MNLISILIQAKDTTARECNKLRDRTVKLEDKTAFLSSKVKDMNNELHSSNAYIDKLYEELQMKSSRSPSKELKADFERKELEWVELERKYSQRIVELEGKVGSELNHKVSMDAYMSVVK